MRRFVFDFDCTLENPYISPRLYKAAREFICDRWGEAQAERMIFPWEFHGHTFYFIAYPGTFELLKWVHSQNIAIDFFSGAIVERNVDLAKMLMHRVFGDEPVSYRVFTTSIHSPTEDLPHYSDQYVGYFKGPQKKKLEGVVTTPDQMADCLLIEDDPSFSAKGEEGNLVYAYFLGSEHRQYFERKRRDPHAKDDYEGLELHHIFYYAGLLQRIVELADTQKMSLRDAAIQAQYLDEGIDFPFRVASNGSVPRPYFENARYYYKGLELLRRYNPDLDFWYGVEEGWWDDLGRNPRRMNEEAIERCLLQKTQPSFDAEGDGKEGA